MKKVLVNEMSWYEFREMMATNDLVIFPVGSIEEHGYHNPLGTDTIIAREVAKEIGERVKAPVAPVMPIGNASNLMGFPGTATIEAEILREVLVQVCTNFIRHGARRFLFINGHGGNTSTIKMVSADLYAKFGVVSTQTEWWLTLPQMSEFRCNDHGGKFETSMMLSINEDIVNMEEAVTVPRKNLSDKLIFEDGLMFEGVKLQIPVRLDTLTNVGNYGARAEEATKEIGDVMREVYVDYCSKLAEELRKITI